MPPWVRAATTESEPAGGAGAARAQDGHGVTTCPIRVGVVGLVRVCNVVSMPLVSMPLVLFFGIAVVMSLVLIATDNRAAAPGVFVVFAVAVQMLGGGLAY
jgi:hypothetical protein